MKITKTQFIYLFILLVFCFNLTTCINISQASLLETAKDGGLSKIGTEAYGGETPDQDIKLITARIVKIFIGFLGIIFVILIIMAGFKYMMSGGNQEETSKALTQIKTGVIGLVIILAAYIITNFVIEAAIETTTRSVN